MKKDFLIIMLIIGFSFSFVYFKFNDRVFYAKDFGIEVIKSSKDFDQDGIDDYTDILLGARKDAQNHPKYKSAYYAGGYPPKDEGVCTDVIWRAFKNAGYILKELVDKDIAENLEIYNNIKITDPNIDFRRVKNLKVFFNHNAIILTNDPYKISEWMPGDIVIFGTNHIGIISDKRNRRGIPYIIHNAGQHHREEDAMLAWHEMQLITGHYRWK